MAAAQLPLLKGIDSAGTDRDAAQLLDLVERVTSCGAWLLEPADRRLTMTERLAALLKLPRTAARSISLDEAIEFYAPESRAAIAAAFSACLEQATPLNLESELITYNGERLWVRTVGRAVRDRAGSLVRIQGMVQDLTEKRRAEQENLSATLRLSLTLASVTLDRSGRYTFVNHESERLLRRSSAELLGHAIWEELAAEDASRLRRELRTALGTGHGIELELHFPALGKWLELRAYPFEEGLAVYLRDVTALRQAREQSLLLQTSINRLNDIVLIAAGSPLTDPEPHIVFVNDAFERHTGFSRAEVLGQTPRMLAGPVTQHKEIDRITQALAQPQSAPVRSELILYKKNGERFWTELEIVGVEYFSPDLTHWIAVARDITERKRNEGEIEHLAFYDALTQLPNRQLLMSRLRHALTQREGVASVGALMFIDLDHFKLLNDSMGHYRGDMLLRHAATRLHNCIGAKDTVARLGGDEFVVMLQDLGESVQQATDQAREVGQRILHALGEPYDLAGYAYHGTCSIGITAFGPHEIEIEDLLKQADLAMYQAKSAGRNTMCFFDPEMQALATANAALTGELRQALREQQFELYYQPQVGRDGRMLGVEALVRWRHPRRGLVNPDDFIPQAEESGLILPLGEWVIETACAQLVEWAGRPETDHLGISVNVSARQFDNADFVDQVMRVIDATGVRADRLDLELTESLLATGMDATIAKMGVLKAAGVTLSIDDFGMGYSALSYLKRLPLDQLKIDRSFVKDMLTDPNDAAIARTIIGLAQSLGLSVIAEGVETEAQRDLLARYGCHGYQGHLFGPALPIAELEAYIRAHGH